MSCRLKLLLLLLVLLQGHKELELFGAIIHPYCNLSQMCTPQGQKDFISSSVLPALNCLKLYAPGVADSAVKNLQQTMAAWNALQEAGMQQPLPDADRTLSQLIQEVKRRIQQQQQQQEEGEAEEEEEEEEQWCLVIDEQTQVTEVVQLCQLSKSCSMSAGNVVSSRGNSFNAVTSAFSAVTC